MNGRLIIASNRTASPGQPRAGGLAMALGDALAERGGVWFGWSGEVVDHETRGVRLVADGNVDFALADLTRSEYDGYYLGYANRALWPVFHYRVDLAHFDEAEFEAYEAVNRRFGRLLAQQLREDDVVWVHDYHFLLMGPELRASGWKGLTGFFLHIPFPAPEVFSSIPQHQRLARGLCAFDLVGFQTHGDAANFRRYLVESAGGEDFGDGRIQAFDRTLTVETFQIGIDPDDIAAAASGDEGQAAAARLGKIIDNRALVIGVDRMDYSKGLPQRMEAFGRMLDDHEDLRGTVSFLQIAPPSREAVDAYQALREELDRIAGRITADYADLDWVPIRYLARGYSRGTLAGLFRISRVGLVTPLRDGMNLVAKEYVAAQDEEDPGVLVLSEFAGAAEQLQAALLVNPHDTAAMADTIHRALAMPLEERRERWRALVHNVRSEDIGWWRRRFLAALEFDAGPGVSPGLADLRLGTGDALFLDFDGTLAEIGPDPEAIFLAPGLGATLGRLGTRLGGALAVVSGRDLRDLAGRVSVGLWRVGGHGLETLSPGAVPGPPPPPPPEAVLAPLRAALVPGVRLELKGPVAALHWRATPEAEAACLAAAAAAAAAAPGLFVQAGKMVVEVKPTGAHKGTALRRLAGQQPFAGRRPVYVGDDTTDEDAIEAALALGGLGIKVGPGPSAASIRASDPAEVRAWLVREAG